MNKLPNEFSKINKKNFSLFFETMYERQLIWKRRFIDKKERPWTNNKILHEYKFTNVYRELDRNSQWEINNIILDKKLTLQNLVWKIIVFRLINNINTFESNKYEYNFFKIKNGKWPNGIPDFKKYKVDEFYNFLEKIYNSGKNPYTSSYLMSNYPGLKRNYFYGQIIIPTVHKNINNIINISKNMQKPENIYNFLLSLPGIGGFTAHEIYQDFTYIPIYSNKELMKFTQNDFTHVGPGSNTGLRLIYPNLKTNNEKLKAIHTLRDLSSTELSKLEHKFKEPFPYVKFDKINNKYMIIEQCNISLNQIEMWLCEFQKYWKMIIGDGKQRKKYMYRK